MLRRVIFIALLLFVAVPSRWVSPPIALVVGVLFGLVVPHPYPAASRRLARILLQVSVVALGFGMNFGEVLRAGASGFVYTLLGIGFALAVGTLVGRILSVPGKAAYLISVGTAICGGSAIAATGPVINASDEEMSVSIGTVFLLNAFGLFLFPPVGHALGLTESQFGLWAALAIHDTSSVVGAAAKFGAVALTIATIVKLVRALWIVPLTLATASVLAARARREHREGPVRKPIEWPWFIVFFLVAAVLRSYVPTLAPIYPWLSEAGRIGLTVTLFLIGTGMSRASLRQVGMRPLVQGVLLWIIVAVSSLLVIRAGWVSVA